MKANPWAAEVREHGLTATFNGDGRQPKCAPDPDYPDGMDADLSGVGPGCAITLQHPAPCAGPWLISCAICGLCVAVTAAGRVDDPRTITIPCRLRGQA